MLSLIRAPAPTPTGSVGVGSRPETASSALEEALSDKVGSSSFPSGLATSWNPNASAVPFVPSGSLPDVGKAADHWLQQSGQGVYDESASQGLYGDSSGQNVYCDPWAFAEEDGTTAYGKSVYMGVTGNDDWLQCGVLDGVLDVLGDEVTETLTPEELESLTAPDTSYHDGSYHTTPDLNPTVAFDSNVGFHTLGMNIVDAEESTTYDPGQRPGNYKTLICRHFERGHCSRGKACNFAHGGAELRNYSISAATLIAQKKDSPRSQLLTMCGAWGALITGPCPQPPLERSQLLDFRYCELGDAAPTEIQSFCCASVDDQVRCEKFGK